MKILGVITARGGSKGIPGKNIKLLAGKPLIAHTIKAAKESGIFDQLIVSTDDENIAAVAHEYGCTIPFLRPAELARDDTPHLAVLQHAVRWLKERQGYAPDSVMILQPTSPLRRAFHIRGSADLFQKTGADSVVSITVVPEHYNPHWQFRVDAENRLSLFTGVALPKIISRRQDLPKTFIRNGAIYLFKTDLLFDPVNPSFYGTDVAGYPMDKKYSANIDTMDDWAIAARTLVEDKT
ncbi:MAG: N-acylneuraminate cytidylyltransferase [Parcubacteria group bacterium Greene0714_36]|nr:MAG: N-acylneuraminate cytidylyltransferase [Parcubacteria group bacterium Greene0714_36]